MNTPIRKGDKVTIRPEYQDKGDDSFDWCAVDDEEKGRVSISPLGTWPIAHVQTVATYMLVCGS